MSRYLLGTFLAALAMFIWGAVFWMNPLTARCMLGSTNDVEAGAALVKYFPHDGTYFLPNVHADETTMNALVAKGPLATVHILTQGYTGSPAKMFILGFVHFWVCTLIAAFVAVRATPAVAGAFGKRLWFFVLIGLLIAVFADLSSPIWMWQPWGFHLVNAVYHASAWLVGGLVLAAAIKPAKA